MCVEPVDHITDEDQILPDECSGMVHEVSFSVCLSVCAGVGCWVCAVGNVTTESGRKYK